MNRGEKAYIIANRIRSKLLLFIDNELKKKPKHPEQKFIKEYPIPEKIITIDYEEIKNEKIKYKYSNEFILPSKTSRNFISNKPKILSPSTVDDTPYQEKPNNLLHQSNSIRNVFQHKTNQEKSKNKIEIDVRKIKIIKSMKINKNIEFDDNKYFIRANKKKSSVFLIEKKIKKDENYLKNLCKRLKKIRKNLSNIKISKSLKKPNTICIQNKKSMKFGSINSMNFRNLFCSVNKKNTENKCLCKLIKKNCKE